MAFEKVVVTSCEDQWYRRCSQIGILEALGFPIIEKDLYHVIWAKPFDDCGEEALIAFLVDMGFENWKDVAKFPESSVMRHYDLSLIEVQIRGLQYCLETNQKILLLQDDVWFTKKFNDIYAPLQHLVNVTAETDPVGICQLDYGADPEGRYSVARGQTRTVRGGMPEFWQGSMGQSTAAIFLTPYGAERILAFLKTAKDASLTTLEVMPPLFWYNEPWMYTVAQRNWARYLDSMNGHNISAKVDEHEHMISPRHGAVARRENSYHFFDKYRIPYQR